MKLRIFLKCEEASHICDKSQYAESSKWERFLMKMHHLMCKVCREHSAINTRLSKLLQRANLKTLPQNSKEEIKKKLQQAQGSK